MTQNPHAESGQSPPETIAGYRVHPAANLFPLMSEVELQELAADIKANGQRDPILLIEDPIPGSESDKVVRQILDGRNRLLACEMAGVEPVFEYVFSKDPVAFVLSKNLQRRHLTAEQRAAIVLQAAALSGELAKVQAFAKARQEAGKTLPPRGGKVKDTTAAVLAKQAGVGTRTVERVQAASKDDPAKLDAIAKGTTTSKKLAAPKPIRYKGGDTRLTSLKLALSSAQETADTLEEEFSGTNLAHQARALVKAIKAEIESKPEPPKPKGGKRAKKATTTCQGVEGCTSEIHHYTNKGVGVCQDHREIPRACTCSNLDCPARHTDANRKHARALAVPKPTPAPAVEQDAYAGDPFMKATK